MRRVECYSCGDKYAQLALHWNGQECDWPNFSDKQVELMKGLLLGDADIKKGTNGSIFRLRMTNKRFLEWVSSRLSPLSRGVFLSESSNKQKESALRGGLDGISDDSEFNDLFGLRTVTHPQIDELNDWYSSGQKRYPNSINENMLRMWYVTDGNIHPSGMRLTCNAQLDKSSEIEEMIKSVDYINSVSFNKDGTIIISSQDSNKFYKSTESPPGFEYKWPGGSP
jgi:hypothetical protein